ncbi:GGDEF domain-containing protein [Nocardioides sambongensis]|uniref:GGDEF domain-containing protein n=1 Tax=Nocardioides sambongensis TaxID=2589074 RepID=UPI0015E842D8|nr:GGDEF domain-containing protein [Nocardioides sambongensis]
MVVGAAAFLDDPANDVWTGGPVFLLGMTVGIGGAAYELARFHRRVVRGDEVGSDDPQFLASLSAITWMTAITAVFYFARMVAMMVAGSESDFFQTYFGSEATTLLVILLMVVAIFSMAALSRTQYTAELRHRATHDGLTGLLNRNEFLRLAELVADRAEIGAPSVVVVADVDRFKQLNDAHGHAAGDRALASVGTICSQHLLPRELAGRMGGDEFALLLMDVDRAHALADVMNEEFALAMDRDATATVSFGVARLRGSEGVAEAMERADRALYDAKARGGRRIMSDERPA